MRHILLALILFFLAAAATCERQADGTDEPSVLAEESDDSPDDESIEEDSADESDSDEEPES